MDEYHNNTSEAPLLAQGTVLYDFYKHLECRWNFSFFVLSTNLNVFCIDLYHLDIFLYEQSRKSVRNIELVWTLVHTNEFLIHVFWLEKIGSCKI